MSKEIKKLEEEVGARLLHRSTRKLQLTPIGEAYLFRCREIVMQVDSAEANIQRLQNNYEGKLRVECANGVRVNGPFGIFCGIYALLSTG